MSPRLRAKVDRNHPEIVTTLRSFGAVVQSLAQVGHGVVDLLVWFPPTRRLVLLEVKQPGEALTPDEQDWHARWAGAPVYVVTTPVEALKAIGLEVG